MPYRVPPPAIEPDVVDDGDREITAVGFFLWLASVVRVALPLLRHERIEGEAAVAVLAAVALPLLAIALRTHKKRARARAARVITCADGGSVTGYAAWPKRPHQV